MHLPRHDLFVHVVKQFSASILVDNAHVTLKRVYQVPVPMMKIDSDIFSPISDAMLVIQIRCCVISWNFDWNLHVRKTLS